MACTHTYAILEISEAAYREIRNKLVAAGYAGQVHDNDGKEVVDMHGIAVQAAESQPAQDRLNVTPKFAGGLVGQVQYISIREFVDQGFLQEANRQFFHPHGLALEITFDDADPNKAILSGVWDYRSDPEGVAFADLADEESLRKAATVAAELERHAPERSRIFGATVQPLGVPA